MVVRSGRFPRDAWEGRRVSHPVRASLLLLVMTAGCARTLPAERLHPAALPPPAPPPVASPAATPERRSARPRAEVEAGIAAAKEGSPYLPMLSQEKAREEMPSMRRARGSLPNLILVGGLLPKTMEAQMAVAQSMRREGGLDGRLLNDVFWEVSSANDCFY
jgi:hypothetical protein